MTRPSPAPSCLSRILVCAPLALGCGPRLSTAGTEDGLASESGADEAQEEDSEDGGGSEGGDSSDLPAEPDPRCAPAESAGRWFMSPSNGAFSWPELVACRVAQVQSTAPGSWQLDLDCPDFQAVVISLELDAADGFALALTPQEEVELRVDWYWSHVGVQHMKVRILDDAGLALGLYAGGPDHLGGFGSTLAMAPLSFEVRDDCPLDHAPECGELEHLVVAAWIDPDAPLELWPAIRQGSVENYQVFVDDGWQRTVCELHQPRYDLELIVSRSP